MIVNMRKTPESKGVSSRSLLRFVKKLDDKKIPMHSFKQSISLSLAGMSVIYLRKSVTGSRRKASDNKVITKQEE